MRKVRFVRDGIYHIYNRGVEKRDIFLADRDRWRFLQGMYLFNNEDTAAGTLWQLEHEGRALNFNTLKTFVAGSERKPLVRLMADCLMPNHYHFILQEIQENGISRFMHKLGVGYTKYFNSKYERVGSLFQSTFKAAAIGIDETYLQYLLVYINVLNPAQLLEPELKKKGVKDVNSVLEFAKQYIWSTHREYLQLRDSVVIEKGILGEFFPSPTQYEQFSRNVVLGKKYEAMGSLLLDPD
ncbi:MAG: hypothetical protein A2984_03210 [Omnitrophica WOR_2 bacterium RIFCSPLOWO2_01_FULL_41_12]|nr:MAG: hypothetical protein A2984_03210 [Omnitrophica WOR_2 bacterium RIFCSPLOWO2_01_FULL_41_12]